MGEKLSERLRKAASFSFNPIGAYANPNIIIVDNLISEVKTLEYQEKIAREQADTLLHQQKAIFDLESRLAEAEKLVDELLGMPKNPEWGFAHNTGRRLKKALRGEVEEYEY
jgi:hypothetical protein